MAPRTSARASASRDKASSPPTKSGQRAKAKSPSPALHATRATRSVSRDLGDNDVDMPPRMSTRSQGVRQGSAESTGSTTSVDSKAGRRRKKTRAAVAIAGDLSMVAEEQDKEQVAEDATVDANDEQQCLQISQSPGAMSSLSGTTALTSHSVQEIADLDSGMIVELIPDLSRDSFRLLELLAPSNTSPNIVETIVKELQVPGSGRGKRLHHAEKTFDSTRENYGSDLFINPSFILRKLFNDQDPGLGDFRPDTVLHEANIATLVKELLITQRENPNTVPLLQRLDDIFPTPFLSGFEVEPQFGTSALLQATFDLGLELRTQAIISILKAFRDDLNYDPDQLLIQQFYESPDRRNESVSTYEDLLANAQFRKIGGINAALSLSQELVHAHSADIRKRVEAIHETFYQEADAIAEGDYVDFDQLHDRFPWTLFLAKVVEWSQLRMGEINKSIEMQGGIESITRSLIEKIQAFDSQIELYYETPKVIKPAKPVATNKSGLLPAANIIPASAGKSLYNSSKSLAALRLLRKPITSSSAPPSNQQQLGAPRRDPPIADPSEQSKMTHNQELAQKEPTTTPARATGPARERVVSDLQRVEDDEDIMSEGDGESSIAEVLELHYEGEKYNHKENRPLMERDSNAAKLRFVDPQPNAERVTWSQQSDDGEPKFQTARRKRSHQLVEDEDEDEDEAFENDPRPVNRSRREQAALPVTQARDRVPDTPSPSKRPRHVQEVAREELREEQEEDALQDERLQASAREADGTPSPTIPSYGEINETARSAKAKSARHKVREPQRRQRWSEDEAQLLRDLIGKYGCQWSRILKEGGDGFFDTRDQVALKDKARNMKVDYLIAGSPLPLNFNMIPLGKKEKEKVKVAGMNPYRREGEEVDHEAYDEDGNLYES